MHLLGGSTPRTWAEQGRAPPCSLHPGGKGPPSPVNRRTLKCDAETEQQAPIGVRASGGSLCSAGLHPGRPGPLSLFPMSLAPKLSPYVYTYIYYGVIQLYFCVAFLFFYILKCLYLFLKFYCSITDLQCCVSSRYTAK